MFGQILSALKPVVGALTKVLKYVPPEIQQALADAIEAGDPAAASVAAQRAAAAYAAKQAYRTRPKF